MVYVEWLAQAVSVEESLVHCMRARVKMSVPVFWMRMNCFEPSIECCLSDEVANESNEELDDS